MTERPSSEGAAPPAPPVELRAEDVTVRFGGVTALENVSLVAREGRILGLIGPNGAGKTTLLNVMTGFIRATAGRVFLRDEDVSRWAVEKLVRHHVARTFQGARVFGRMTVRENIEVGAVGQGVATRVAAKRADQLIDEYGLGQFRHRLASTLPAGMRRRLGIARALASEPRLILMDEPAAGLNESERVDLVRVIASVRDRSRCGIVIVEHSMPVIMELCDELHVLDGGRTLAIGTPAEVRVNPLVRTAYLGSD